MPGPTAPSAIGRQGGQKYPLNGAETPGTGWLCRWTPLLRVPSRGAKVIAHTGDTSGTMLWAVSEILKEHFFIFWLLFFLELNT